MSDEPIKMHNDDGTMTEEGARLLAEDHIRHNHLGIPRAPTPPPVAPKCELCDLPRPPGCGLCGVPDDGAEFDVRLPDDEPSADADLGDLTKHAMNCGWYGSYGDADCTCSLKLRVALSTERTMHRAWRKRAEEAEATPSKPEVGADDEASEAFLDNVIDGLTDETYLHKGSVRRYDDDLEALRRHIAGLRADVAEKYDGAVKAGMLAGELATKLIKAESALAACRAIFAQMDALDITKEEFIMQGPGRALRALREITAMIRALAAPAKETSNG